MKKLLFITGILLFSFTLMGQNLSKKAERKIRRAKKEAVIRQRNEQEQKQERIVNERNNNISYFEFLSRKIQKNKDPFTGITSYESNNNTQSRLNIVGALYGKEMENSLLDGVLIPNLLAEEKNGLITYFLSFQMFSKEKYAKPTRFLLKINNKIIKLDTVNPNNYFTQEEKSTVVRTSRTLFGIKSSAVPLALYSSIINIKISKELAYKICYSLNVIIRANSNLIGDNYIKGFQQRQLRYLYDYMTLKKLLGK